MKKQLLVTALVTGLLLGLGGVFSQELGSAEHDVVITIPDLAAIRFTSGDSVESVSENVDVIIDLLSIVNIEDLLDPDGHTHTGVVTWDDVQVFYNDPDGTWTVTVSVDYAVGSEDFPWNQVSVAPTNAAAFGLGAPSTPIVTEDDTLGWTRLGFGQEDFVLVLNGGEQEAANTYSATVTYTLATP